MHAAMGAIEHNSIFSCIQPSQTRNYSLAYCESRLLERSRPQPCPVRIFPPEAAGQQVEPYNQARTKR